MCGDLLHQIKVGNLVPVRIIKALPDYDSMLTFIAGTELMALLPKKFSNRTYRVGDSTLASIYSINGRRIIVSQKSPHYFRKLTELLLAPLLQKKEVEVKRVAIISKAKFVKVAVRSLNNEENPIKICLPYMREAKRYTDDTITLVKFSNDIREFVVNSLSPAPKEGVRKVILFQELREAIVKVEPRYLGLFLGKGGLNVALSSKLVGFRIRVEPTEN